MTYYSQEKKDRFLIQDVISDEETENSKNNNFVKKHVDFSKYISCSRKRFIYKQVLDNEMVYQCKVLNQKQKRFVNLNEIEKKLPEIEKIYNNHNVIKEEIVPENYISGEKSYFSHVKIIKTKTKQNSKNRNSLPLLNTTNDSHNIINIHDDHVSETHQILQDIDYTHRNTKDINLKRNNKFIYNSCLKLIQESSLTINKNCFIDRGCFEVFSYQFEITAAYNYCSECFNLKIST